MKQKDIIIRYLQYCNEWKPAYILRGLSTPFGFLGHQADRRARELFVEGKIEHKIEGKFSFYRAKPLTYKTYKILNTDGSVEKVLNYQTN